MESTLETVEELRTFLLALREEIERARVNLGIHPVPEWDSPLVRSQAYRLEICAAELGRVLRKVGKLAGVEYLEIALDVLPESALEAANQDHPHDAE